MKRNYHLPLSLKYLSLALGSVFILASCGSTQSFYDEDGIYSNPNSTAVVDAQTDEESKNAGSYFKNYFEQEAAALVDPESGDLIFTDVDSYTSEGAYSDEIYDEEVEGSFDNTGRAAWGDETDQTIVNVYNGGFGFGGFGCFSCFNRFGFGFGGFGFNRFGFGGFGFSPFGFGFNRFGFGFGGFGFGGFGFGFGGFGFPYYGGFFGNGFSNNGAFVGNFNRSRNSLGGRAVTTRGRQAARIVSGARQSLRNRSRIANNSRSRSTFSRSRGTVRPRTTGANSMRNGRNRGIARSNSQSRGIARPNGTRPRGNARPCLLYTSPSPRDRG